MKIEIDVNMNDRADVLTAYDALWHLQRTLAKHVPVEKQFIVNPARGTSIEHRPINEPQRSRTAAKYNAQ